MSRSTAGLMLALGTFALSSPVIAGALPFDCASLQAVVAEAPTRFTKITVMPASKKKPADPAAQEGLSLEEVLKRRYAHSARQSLSPLAGAQLCRILDTWTENADARISQISHECHYPGVTALTAAFNAQLAQCLDRPADPDADVYSAAIDIDTVASGEGYAHTQVTANAQPVDGLRISVVQTICENRREGGCDDSDVD